MSCIEVKNLTLGYGTEPVIKGLSFSVGHGEYICIVGENGSGKSTLVKALLKLVIPLKGSIEYSCKKCMKGIGYLPQQMVVQQDFPASVTEVVRSGFVGKSLFDFDFRGKNKRKAHDIMHTLSIEHLGDRCFRELSGGQQQKVLLARALCATESVLLLDEPVTGLDPVSTAEMYSIIEQLNKDGMTVLMISHDVLTAVEKADKILHISNDVSFFGTAEEYKASDIGKAFLKGAAK